MSKTTYWGSNGKYQTVYEKLHTLIPHSGPLPEARSSQRALEKLRVASNCYYDLFNNGLCNRAAEFRRVFGFGGKYIVESRFQDVDQLEEAMDRIILAAAKEQGIEMLSEDVTELLKIFQSRLGNSREQCSEYDQPLWDRIAALTDGRPLI